MTGINRETGQMLNDTEHLSERIKDLLTTPVGTRSHRRTYGCDIYKYIDAPITEGVIADIIAEVADAINKWEPEFGLSKVNVINLAPGVLELEVIGKNGALIIRNV